MTGCSTSVIRMSYRDARKLQVRLSASDVQALDELAGWLTENRKSMKWTDSEVARYAIHQTLKMAKGQ